MESPTASTPRGALSDYLAAERTQLAWIRTGLALMGFGFVVARFGLFLQEIQFAEQVPGERSYGLSLWFGTALIVVGVVVNLVSGWQHARLIHELDRGQAAPRRPSTPAVAVAVFLAVVGLAMAIYLVSVRSSESSTPHSSKESSMAPIPSNGIITRPSNHSVDETVARLEALLQGKGVTLFALVDHSGEAAKVGLTMPPTKLLIFGNPRGGTPLMLAAPSIAIDLPLKVLIAEDAQGTVSVSYNSPVYLQQRHGLPKELLQNVAVVETFAAKAAE
jgi:uncharacterized protein (DUF302 family)/uncharacterized membrane protein YidH (DUF202 family)